MTERASTTATRHPAFEALQRFRENQLAFMGLIVVLLLGLAALAAPLLAPHDPVAIGDVVSSRYAPPSLAHLFGTDAFGRDIFSRVIYGARISLSIGLLAMLIASLVGTAIGATSAYLGGRWDNVIMRFVDVMMAFPMIFLLLLLVGVFENSVTMLILILGFSSWMGTARLVRAEVLSLKSRGYIEAARAIGLPAWRILTVHVIPRAASPLLVSAALSVGGMIGAEAGLSFLGLGIQPPTPSWGAMIQDGQEAMAFAWWVAFFPGLFLALTLVSFALIADGLRDALDVRLMPWSRT
jgi:peptide/nickel transport system permease protein